MPEPCDCPASERPTRLSWPAGGWPFEAAAATARSLAEAQSRPDQTTRPQPPVDATHAR